MRTISLWQPWATLCVATGPDGKAFKRLETRHWPTNYRGPLLIHAAKKWSRELEQHCVDLSDRFLFGQDFNLEFGAIVGQVNLISCHQMKDLPAPSPLERATGHWDDEGCRYAWEFTDPVMFVDSVPYRGQQGFFNVQGDAVEAVRGELLRAAGSR